MEQIKRLLNALSARQKAGIVLAAALVGGGLIAFLRWHSERDFQLLYGNLAAEDAAAVVERLKESGVEYRLSQDGTSIRVRSAQVADLRLQMAGAGLPKTGRVGFELFDRNSFGATEFSEHVNYHRALEGELERSIMALSEVEHARVHITEAKHSVFADSRQPAKASVLVKLRPGAMLSPAHVQAIAHLVASAVEGLQPEWVSILDVQGNLLSRPRRTSLDGGPEPGEAGLEYRAALERELLKKIQSTLEPVLGLDRFRAGVSVDVDFSSGELSEEVFDPTRSVMARSQRTEDVAGAGRPAGVPGAASNLPRPAARPSTGAVQGVTRRTENIDYQSTRTVRRSTLPQGEIRRISVALLLDHHLRFEGTGAKARRILEPPSPERIKSVRELVSGALGLKADRGDQLIIESLPFESTLNAAPPPGETPPAPKPASTIPIPAWLQNAIDKKDMVVLGGLAGGALLVMLFGAAAAFLLLRRRRKAKVTVQGQLTAGKAADEVAGGTSLIEKKLEEKIAQQAALKERQEAEVLSSLKLPSVATKKGEVLAKHLAEEAKKNPVALAHVIRTWMSDNEP